ncbi:hypothetical protein B9Z19DRAFT_1078676 [Tuber borchii]|uniref:Uncharacterized protein n=1 Tax=Tuber borchii TaxID=42251 RepID=A0A2T6ZZ88_TUBBO|nr:hypothetical protein B9Z19DRAFT_1078676 [Tuber borchii]
MIIYLFLLRFSFFSFENKNNEGGVRWGGGRFGSIDWLVGWVGRWLLIGWLVGWLARPPLGETPDGRCLGTAQPCI